MRKIDRGAVVWICLMAMGGAARASDLVTLSPQTWDRNAPQGKEADAIYGDFVLANDQLIAVVANPKRGRNANMTVREVGGALIDLTRRDRQSDQLSAFYPGAQTRQFRFGGIDVAAPETYVAEDLAGVFARARRVTLRLVAAPRPGHADIQLSYSLADGSPFVEVATVYSNTSDAPVDVDFVDSMRLDGMPERAPDGPSEHFWAFDGHFGQAYGVIPAERTLRIEGGRAIVLRYADAAGKVAATLGPGESATLVRRVFPAADPFGLLRVSNQIAGKPDTTVVCRVVELGGAGVAGASVALESGGKPVVWGRTDENGEVRLTLPGRPVMLAVSGLGYERRVVALEAMNRPITLRMEKAGAVVARITDEQGGPIPCKVQFIGRDGAASPNFGPDAGEHGVRNVYYSHDGRFRQKLDPGRYDVIISRGPEYHAVFTDVAIERGAETPLEAKLARAVDTAGWISADFHSHSSPSGDNTASQYGRVLNLLCEHIEFAPCTEHNRLSTYDPHLKRLGAERLMATCVGIELTGSPLPLNHQNAFPLVLREHEQDGGGPETDLDPETQIERLALWDGGSEKLVQVNHPDMGWMFFDRNGDGVVDGGFSGMFGRMDVIEVHPPHHIFMTATIRSNNRDYNNTMHNWLQVLNQGRRIPGVVNTDAHYNFHGSGWLRNYIKSPTDDPAEIQVPDVVRASERGQVVMTNGPFLEVALEGEGLASPAGVGDTVALSSGKGTLHVRVQCANWFDVDRVQVFVNGLAEESLNFTRAGAPERFSDGVLKFNHEIPIQLAADAHLIVAAIGDNSRLGPVMGPDHQNDKPVAVSNPIFVDVDGNGFKPNGDALGGLPTKGGR